VRFDFLGDAYRARSLNANASQTINFYPEVDKSGKNVVAMYGCPGTIERAAGSGEVRGYLDHDDDDITYVVIGNKFYSFDTSETLTELGTISSSTGYVSIASNGLVVIFVDGVKGYSYNISSATFGQITDPDFPALPTAVDILSGIFIIMEGDSQRFLVSYDGTSYAGLDFASAESSPDDLVGLIVDHQELILGGIKSTEVHYLTSDVFPFARRAVIETGWASTFGACKADNSVFFLGADKVIWRLNGYQPTRISTHAIEYAISQYDVGDCRMWAEKREGHLFIWCQFPTGNETWVFDVATGLWHRRAYRDPATGTLGRHRANCHLYLNNKHYVGDYTNGKIYELSMDAYDDDGDDLPAIRVCKHIADGGLKPVFHHRLQLDVETGVGLVSGNGSDPQMLLKWSDDGGHTYGNDVEMPIGAIGEYSTRVIWEPLGRAYDRVYWAQITDPVKRVIVGAALDTTVGR
jgi:hypothetical protein